MSESRSPAVGAFPKIATGLDLEDLTRWRAPDMQVLRPESRIFSPAEHDYCQQFPDPIPHYAARWCAKEAVIKAFSPVCRLLPSQIEIQASEGAPRVRILVAYPEAQIAELSLSMTHTKHTAAASVVLLYWPPVQLE